MPLVLDYSIEKRSVVRPALGIGAALTSGLWACALNVWLVATAQDYFLWNQQTCGTAALRIEHRVFNLSPLMLGVPIVCWAMARAARFGERWARCGCLVSATAWAVTVAFIRWAN